MRTRFITISLRPALAYIALSIWLPLLVYASVQQALRMSANDPQVQLAEDTAAALSLGQTPGSLVTGLAVDMRRSLAPFLIITDSSRHILASNVQLDGAVPLPPTGSFDTARSGQRLNAPTGENRITWEPAPGVREAVVIVAYNGGYVLSARNLREVEFRSERVLGMTAGAIALLGVLGLVLSANIFKRKS
ncbi:MAG: hypothetical protein NVSMB39_6280 [Candidatus Saccharimonadales bacterium]